MYYNTLANKNKNEKKSYPRWSPLPRAELFDVFISGVYRAEYEYIFFAFRILGILVIRVYYEFRAYESYICWPSVAFLFSVFALGALCDPARPPFSIESQEYYLLSRVTLINFAEPLFNTTISCVLTLVRYNIRRRGK